MKEEEALLVWDECEIICGLARDKGCEAVDLETFEIENETGTAFEDVLFYLTILLDKYAPDGYWHVDTEGFGWRNLDGEVNISAADGEEFLRKILPDCDCNFHIYDNSNSEKDERGLKIHNFHHDSPTGEWYFCYPLTEEEYNEGLEELL